MFLYIGKFGFTNLRLQVILFLFMELILFGIIIKKIINKVNNDGLILLFYVLKFYFVKKMICKLFKIVHKYVIILIVDYNIKYDKFSSLL